MDDMELFKKLAQCEDKEQMQRVIEAHNESQKPQTNADRIRAMSDEQLAKLFMDFAVKCYDDCGVSAEIITTDYVMEWLKQPAEER